MPFKATAQVESALFLISQLILQLESEGCIPSGLFFPQQVAVLERERTAVASVTPSRIPGPERSQSMCALSFI